MSEPAKREALAALHVKVAEELADILTNGEKVTDREGNLVKLSASAAVLNVARQFLKDNDVKALAGVDSPLDKLSKSVPQGTKLPFEGEPRH